MGNESDEETPAPHFHRRHSNVRVFSHLRLRKLILLG